MTVQDESIERPCAGCGVAITVHRDSDAAHTTRLFCEACEERACRHCGRPHDRVPEDLCPPALQEYRRVDALGKELGLTP